MIDLVVDEIVGVSFPKTPSGLTLVKLANVGVVGVAGSSDTYEIACACEDFPGSCTPFNATGYLHDFAWENLSAPLASCEQVGYIAEGRTSGATLSLSGLPLADLGLNCFTAECSLTDENGVVIGIDWSWTLNPGGYDGTLSAITPAATDFVDAERIDLWVGQIEFEIASITEGDPGSILVETVEQHKMVNGAWVEVSGTVNYDGLYIALRITNRILDLLATYVGDEAAGLLIPRYDQ